jgi:hypothetical protein
VPLNQVLLIILSSPNSALFATALSLICDMPEAPARAIWFIDDALDKVWVNSEKDL